VVGLKVKFEVEKAKFVVECKHKGKFVASLLECFHYDKSIRKELTLVIDCLGCPEFVGLKKLEGG